MLHTGLAEAVAAAFGLGGGARLEGPVRAYGWAEVRATDRQLDPAAVGRDAWERLVTRLERARAPFAGQLAALVPELVEAAGVQTPPRCTRRCHRDLWADNVRAAPSGGLVVLDWENSGPADPARELGVVLYEFGCGDRGRMRALVDAYEGAGGTARLTFPADLTMLVAQTHHIARTACERWLASRTEEERADNAAWALEFLDDPVTLRTVELLLDAVG